MTNSFIYKIAFISLTIILWTACQQQKVETLSNSNVNSNSANSEKDEKYYDELRKAEVKKQFKEWNEKQSKDFSLSILENEEVKNDFVEIRFWSFSSFSTQDSVLVLIRSDNVWTANFIQRNIKIKDLDKENPPAKFIRKKLNKPKSGWENLWETLVSEQVFILPDGDEVGNSGCTDCQTFRIETKAEGNYRVYDYHAPGYFKEIKEAQQLVKIYDIISDEFRLIDFKPAKYEDSE